MSQNNLVTDFLYHVNNSPDKIAFVIPENIDSLNDYKEKLITFSHFYEIVAKYRKGLKNEGYVKGDRIIILAPINEKTYALMLAIFSLGMVVVFLDPGIGLKKILRAISDSKAKAIISVDKLLKYHFLFPSLWKKTKYTIDQKRIGLKQEKTLYAKEYDKIIAEKMQPDDYALMTYTSGSTGKSKGTNRNIENITKQINFIKKAWPCHQTTIDFPSFPMFGLMNLLCGITTVVPAVNFSNIGSFNPEVVIKQMEKWNITRMCGSYAFHNKLVKKLKEKKKKITSLKNIAFGGCPVTEEFCQGLFEVYPNAKTEIIYGSTEVAPISSIEINEFLAAKGDGFLVGHIYPGLQVKVVKLPQKIYEFDHQDGKQYEMGTNSIGEVIIQGPHVVQEYIDNPQATKENKIKSPTGKKWHRSGDCGYFDNEGRLWLVGRINDIIWSDQKELHPYSIEAQLDRLQGIQRSALVQKGKEIKLFIEGQLNTKNQPLLKQLLQKNNLEKVKLQSITKIPVDDRHNSKIDRVKLRGMI